MAGFDVAALLIGLREGLEALLILGILLGLLRRFDAQAESRRVWWGAGLGLAASIACGLIIQTAYLAWFEAIGAALFEIVVALVAVGILTYMVLWMHQHTKQLVDLVHARVKEAKATGRWALIGALAFFTVFREGIEVVLFFAARSVDVAYLDLVWGGLVGLALSAVIAFAIFRLSIRVSLKAFFAFTGGLLILVAGGLLIHVLHAAAELGWVGHGQVLWDTSHILPSDNHWLGGPLHALIGYEAQPTTTQAMVYLAYVVGVGGWFMVSLREKKGLLNKAPAAAAIVILLVFGLVASAGTTTNHGHQAPTQMDTHALTADARAALDASSEKVGILIRSHGEPQHYNASTYASFKQFIADIWPYTGLPAELLTVDAGTYYMDEAHPFGHELETETRLVDAWLSPPATPAVPTCTPLGLTAAAELFEGCFHVTPGTGAGMGEGDLFELFGLDAYRTWLKMENHSPKVNQTEAHFAWMESVLAKQFGAKVVAAYAYHLDPKMGEYRSLEGAARHLIDSGATVILDAYHSSIHSDAMNTCMMQAHAYHALEEAGFSGRIVPVGMAGLEPAWGQAVANYVLSRMDHFHEGERVSIHLAQHGGNPKSSNPCGDGPDQYHANARAQFNVTASILRDTFGDTFVIRHVYGQGATLADDGALSPMEALDLDREAGIGHAIVIPYEFWSDAMDNLVALREGLGYTPDQAPYYDAAYETHATLGGIHIDVWSAHYGVTEKGTALLAQISKAMVTALASSEGATHGNHA